MFRLFLLFWLLIPLMSQAAITTKRLQYTIDDQTFSGFIAWPEAAVDRPGVLILHEWWGHSQHIRERAERLAEQGYTALAIDLYGTGRIAEDPDAAKAYMDAMYARPETVEERVNAAVKILRRHRTTDGRRIAAIGYGLGGAIVLHMARIGTELDAFISFHGSLVSRLPYSHKHDIQGFIQVFSGGADRLVPAVQVADFTQEMMENQAAFNIQVYPGVRHSFTRADADQLATRFKLPLAYDAEADGDSWQRTLQLLDSVFAE